jgi:hypothetical protein
VLVDAEGRGVGDVVDHVLEALVGERLDLSAHATDEVVMVITCGLGRLVTRASGAQVEPVDEAEGGERLESPIDARDSHPGTPGLDELVDFGHGKAAALNGEHLDYGGTRGAGPETGRAKDKPCMLAPRHARR